MKNSPKVSIAQADVAQRFDLLEDVLLVLEKCQGFVDAHFQYIIDVLLAIGDFKDLVLESFAVAHFTREVNVGKELHFHHLFAFAFTGVAAAAVDVERKVFGLKAPHFAERLVGVKVADLVVGLNIGDRVAAGGLANRILVDHLYLGDHFEIALDGFVKANLIAGLSF